MDAERLFDALPETVFCTDGKLRRLKDATYADLEAHATRAESRITAAQARLRDIRAVLAALNGQMSPEETVGDLSTRVSAERRRSSTLPDIVGMKDIAERCGMSLQSSHVWRTRGVFIEPDGEISGLPFWIWEHVENWLRATNRTRQLAYWEEYRAHLAA